MIPRYRIILPIVAMLLALIIAPAFAAKPKTMTHPAVSIPAGTPRHEVGFVSSTAAVCQLGQPNANFQYPWLYPPDDWYSTFIDPDLCGCPNGVNLTAAHWILNWTSACQIDNVIVEVDAAVETSPGSGCWVPDFATVLCGPVTTSLSSASPQILDHSIPLTCTCLTQKAFITFKLPTTGNCPTNPDGTLASPLYVFDNTADACTSYNTFPGSGGPVDMLTFGFPGNTSMYVEADCCPSTATIRETWGKVRTLYR
jgi:hypothetical protein